jgi:hypothetical protein
MFRIRKIHDDVSTANCEANAQVIAMLRTRFPRTLRPHPGSGGRCRCALSANARRLFEGLREGRRGRAAERRVRKRQGKKR